MDNKKVIVKETRKYGKSLFAKEDLTEGEKVAEFDGKIYEAEKCSDLPNEPPDFIRDHAIQFEEHKCRDSKGFARNIAHSCSPNCGIKNKFIIVTRRAIKTGEELTIDYDLMENGDWQIDKCFCGSSKCRKVIRGYRYLSNEYKNKNIEYTSDYLLNSEE